MPKVALLTGVTGQDGTLLADFLLAKGYKVHGLRLYAAHDDTQRIVHLQNNQRFHLHYGDLTDGGSLSRLLNEIRPDELYNLGAQSHVQVSFAAPEATANINALGPLRLLEALRGPGLERTRFYQASSSEMFGNAPGPQNEDTPLNPCSPYGAAKVFAYHTVRNYRQAYGLHASNGILFNHESPLRGEEFVTRKVTRAAAAIAAGRMDMLRIGNLDARRDWGHARDYVEGMWLMLQQDKPDDYVLATGQARSVRDFITAAFACAGMQIRWQGAGPDEKGIEVKTGRVIVAVDPRFFRPADLHELIGDASRARRVLGWKPRTPFAALVREMVEADRRALEAGIFDDRDLLAAE